MDSHILESKAVEEVRHVVSFIEGIAGGGRVYEQDRCAEAQETDTPDLRIDHFDRS